MSEDQEMMIRGRLFTDYGEAKKKRTLLQAERERIGNLLNYVGTCISAYDPSNSSTITQAHFDAMDQNNIELLIEDTHLNNEKLRDLKQKLT